MLSSTRSIKIFFSSSVSQKDKKKTDKNTKILYGILITKRSHKYKEILRHKMDKNLLHQTILSCGAANFCAPNLIIIIRFYATGSAVIQKIVCRNCTEIDTRSHTMSDARRITYLGIAYQQAIPRKAILRVIQQFVNCYSIMQSKCENQEMFTYNKIYRLHQIKRQG